MFNTATTPIDPWPQPVRRIITSHAHPNLTADSLPPHPGSSTSPTTPGPSSSAPPGSHVIQHTSLVPLVPILSSSAAVTPLFSHPIPTISAPHLSSSDIDEAVSAVPGVVLPDGVNGQITELKPGVRVGMHRTNSVDYNVMVRGGAWHITPDPTVEGKEQKEWVGEGDVVVQRGTMHAWQAGAEGARWVCVVVAAKPVVLDGKELEEIAF